MLTLFRRHTKSCKDRHGGKDKGRKFRKCDCPLHAEGTMLGVMYRRALDTGDWSIAQKRLRQIEERGAWDEPAEDKQAAIRKSLERAMTFYTPEEVAAILKVKIAAVKDLISRGQLRAVRIGGEFRIADAALQKCLDALSESTASPQVSDN
jgi:excisionase family DNA binding protein